MIWIPRRSWFLERVLKLGLVPIAKEYQCVSDAPFPQMRTTNLASLVYRVSVQRV